MYRYPAAGFLFSCLCVGRRFHWDQLSFYHSIPINTIAVMANAPEITGLDQVQVDQNANEKSGREYADIGHVERVMSREEDLKDHMDLNRVDSEVAKYTSNVREIVSEEESARLLKMIDRRVLVIMILTYFLQAIDKGTLSFASIMGLQKDLDLVGQEVRHHLYLEEKHRSLLTLHTVFLAHHWRLHCDPHR